MEYRTGSGCLCIVITLVLGLFAVQSQAEDPQIGIALLNFMKALAKDQLIWNNWNSTPDPCSESWKGIICKNKLNVSHVILEDMGLDGRIDGEALCQVKTLKVLSLKKNNLQGPIPDAISKCEQIQRIYLADNQLSGNIPTSLSALRKLIWLDVSNNKLTGPLPPFNLTGFMSFNVSNNNLSGRIPNTGDRFNSSYGGNPGLCKSPLAPCNSTISPLPSPSPFPRNYKKVSDPGLCESPLAPCNATMSPVPSPSPSPATHDRVSEIIAMWAGYIALFFVIALFFIFIFLYKKKYFSVIEDPKEDRIGAHQMNAEKKTKDLSFTEADSRSSDYTVSLSESKSSSLIFLDRSRKAVKFEDLLRASADLLGKGSFGSLYKVIMQDGSALAVKRIKDVTVLRQEFERRMVLIGSIKHPNVLPLLAYYCSKDEKLLVYDYQRNGSISALLHGHFPDRKLDWHTRLVVASGVAHGLAYMHQELKSQNIPHGNLKSSNILLNDNFDPCISEYGLSFLNDLIIDPPGQWSGYRAPECHQNKKITQKADVYSFGVMLLELLTGKIVESTGLDLPRWVHSVVREEWTVEVFDKVMVDDSPSEERMVTLLQIAVNCVSYAPNNRPTMIQVAKLIDKLREDEERSLDQNFGSMSTSDGDTTPEQVSISR